MPWCRPHRRRVPSLKRPRLQHASDDAALANVIANGIPNTAMPRIRRFTEGELRQLVAYVRSIGRAPQDRVQGDAKRGAAITKNLACSSCHIVAGEGGNLGPDLTDIGFLRGAAYLREAVVAPDSSLPRGTLSVLSRGYAEYCPSASSPARATRSADPGQRRCVHDSGARPAGRFYSLRKTDVEQLDKPAGKSMMPSFASRVTAPELANLVAYLASLRGGEQ